MTTSTHCDISPRLRDAMAAFPSGVTIMTTADRTGRHWGFTASSFCSLSPDPPLVLVCLGKTARCHPAFQQSDDWTIQIVAPRHPGEPWLVAAADVYECRLPRAHKSRGDVNASRDFREEAWAGFEFGLRETLASLASTGLLAETISAYFVVGRESSA